MKHYHARRNTTIQHETLTLPCNSKHYHTTRNTNTAMQYETLSYTSRRNISVGVCVFLVRVQLYGQCYHLQLYTMGELNSNKKESCDSFSLFYKNCFNEVLPFTRPGFVKIIKANMYHCNLVISCFLKGHFGSKFRIASGVYTFYSIRKYVRYKYTVFLSEVLFRHLLSL